MLLRQEVPDFEEAIRQIEYDGRLRKLQIQLIKLQNWVVQNDQRIIVIFEGGEFSGKGMMIRAFMDRLNPRSARLVALPKPTEKEQGEWYFQRYVNQLPRPGELTFFNRSWYNRAVVEPVNGFCTQKKYKQFMKEVNDFERMLSNDGITIVKFFLSITKDVQSMRLKEVQNNPLRRWKLTQVDLNVQENWDQYLSYQKKMLDKTNTKRVPWKIIDSNNPRKAHFTAIKHLLSTVPYKGLN